MVILPLCVCVICVQSLWRPEEGFRTLRTRVTDDWELPCRCQESNLEPLKEQQVLIDHWTISVAP